MDGDGEDRPEELKLLIEKSNKFRRIIFCDLFLSKTLLNNEDSS